jgi:metallo-beta-lactamase family protein
VGHLLGSAMVEVKVEDESRVTILFSGDVGRYGAPLVRDPAPPPACDVLVVESTYGDRLHPAQGPAATLCGLLARAQRERGIVLIPAFAVGRAQQIVLLLRRAMERGDAPEMAIHLDSPMAVDATGIYLRHPEESGLERLDLEAGDRTIFGHGVYLHRSREESIRLNALEGPRVIVSSSGMLTGGRVLHHLRRLLPEPRHVIVLAGFQPAGTRGRSLLEGARHLRMHGQDVPVRALVEQVPGLSAHADQSELLRWLRGMPAPPRRTVVVHGEPEASAAFAAKLRDELGHDCRVPAHLERVDLDGTGG